MADCAVSGLLRMTLKSSGGMEDSRMDITVDGTVGVLSVGCGRGCGAARVVELNRRSAMHIYCIVD